MGARKSKPVDVELQEDLVNENQEISPNHFQVDADFFDLSDPEKQKSADEEKRYVQGGDFYCKEHSSPVFFTNIESLWII